MIGLMSSETHIINNNHNNKPARRIRLAILARLPAIASQEARQ